MCRAPEVYWFLPECGKCLVMCSLAPRSAEHPLNGGTLHRRVHLLAGLSRKSIPSGKSGPTGMNCSSTRFCFRSEEHTSELQSRGHLGCRLLLEKKNHKTTPHTCCKVSTSYRTW